MQLFFLPFVSSLLWASLEVMVKLSDYFWKPNCRFSKFCVNCILRIYLVYCNNCVFCVLNDIKGPYWFNCSVETLRVPDMCLGPAKTRKKTWKFLRCTHSIDLVLKNGSDIDEGTWLLLLFCFIVNMGRVAAVIVISSISCVSRFRLSFPRIALWRRSFAIGIQTWFDHEWAFLGFSVWKSLLSLTLYIWTKIRKKCSNVFLFWWHQFFWCLVWRVVCPVLGNRLYFFAIGLRKIQRWAFRMQCNFFFRPFVPSNLFFMEVVVKLFDHFWKPNSLVSKFCVNCFLMFYFVYCINCGLKEFNGTCNWTCSLVALRVPEMCFWAAKTRKNHEHFEMHTFYWPGGQTWFGHKWRKLDTASPLILCIDGYSCLRFWNDIFFSFDSIFRLEFSLNASWRKRLQLNSKSDLTKNGLISGSCVGKWLLSLTSFFIGLKSARIDQLFFFFDDIKFFRCLVWRVVWSVL